jgi:LacI family transcriptional regulator
LERNDIEPQPELVMYGDYERDIARSEVLKIVKLGSCFSAVYALSDTMAIGVYEALRELDRSIPGDVSVIGTNDSFFSCNMAPPLTTIRKQVFACGEEAAKLLLRTINTGKTGRKVWLDSELVLRSSTRVCIEGARVAEPATNM